MLQIVNIGNISIDMYNALNYVGIAALYLWAISQRRPFSEICPQARRQTSEKKKLLVSAAVFCGLTLAGLLLLLVLNQKFGDWFTDGNKNYYGSLTAWLIAFPVLTSFLKIPPLRALDLLTPGLPMSLAISKLACVCYGCCYSFEMPGSFYYNICTNRCEFPVQMVEAAVAFLIFIFLLWYRKRTYREGTLFPLYVAVYSVSRFLTEFLRADLPDVLGGFDAYQIMSVVYLIIGLLLFMAVRKYGDRIRVRTVAQ